MRLHLDQSGGRRFAQRGFLLESLGLLLLVLSMIALNQMNRQFEQDLDAEAIRRGKALAIISSAAHNYLVNYASQLVNMADLNLQLDLATGAGVPVRVARGGYPTLLELNALGLTPPNLSSTAPGGGKYVIQIEKSPHDCVAPNCNLEGLVTVNRPYLMNGKVDYARLGMAAAAVGPDGAFSTRRSPEQLTGYGGMWKVDNPVIPALGQLSGILAARFGYASTELAVFYKRDGSTPLTGDMDAARHAIKGVSTFNADGKITGKNFITPLYRPGDPCEVADENAFASSAGAVGAVLVCQLGQWRYARSNPVVQGAACAPDGSTGTAANGETLICKSAVYVRLNNLIARNVQVERQVVIDGSVVPIPLCETGGVPENSILIDHAALDVTEVDPRQALDAIAVRAGDTWQVSLKLIDTHGTRYSGNGYGLRAVMNLECRYQ